MYKKFLAFSAASAIAFVACSPDNSTAPFEEVSYNSSSSQIVSSSSVQDIGQNSDNLNLQTPGSSSSELSTPQSSSAEYSTPQTFSKNECTVKKLSDNTIEMNTVVAGQAATKTTMVFVGDMVEIESSMTYDAALPDSFVEEQCAESDHCGKQHPAENPPPKRGLGLVRIVQLEFGILGYARKSAAERNIHDNAGVDCPAVGIEHGAEVAAAQLTPGDEARRA